MYSSQQAPMPFFTLSLDTCAWPCGKDVCTYVHRYAPRHMARHVHKHVQCLPCLLYASALLDASSVMPCQLSSPPARRGDKGDDWWCRSHAHHMSIHISLYKSPIQVYTCLYISVRVHLCLCTRTKMDVWACQHGRNARDTCHRACWYVHIT